MFYLWAELWSEVRWLPVLPLFDKGVCEHLEEMPHIQTIVKFHDESPVAKKLPRKNKT